MFAQNSGSKCLDIPPGLKKSHPRRAHQSDSAPLRKVPDSGGVSLALATAKSPDSVESLWIQSSLCVPRTVCAGAAGRAAGRLRPAGANPAERPRAPVVRPSPSRSSRCAGPRGSVRAARVFPGWVPPPSPRSRAACGGCARVSSCWCCHARCCVTDGVSSEREP